MAVSGDLTLEIRRVFPAAASVVFGSFSAPNELAKWWGPTGLTVPSLEFTPRVEIFTALRCCPRAMPSISSESSARSTRRPASPTRSYGRTRIPTTSKHWSSCSSRDLGASTEVVLTQGPFKTVARRELHRNGWTGLSRESRTELVSQANAHGIFPSNGVLCSNPDVGLAPLRTQGFVCSVAF